MYASQIGDLIQKVVESTVDGINDTNSSGGLGVGVSLPKEIHFELDINDTRGNGIVRFTVACTKLQE